VKLSSISRKYPIVSPVFHGKDTISAKTLFFKTKGFILLFAELPFLDLIVMWADTEKPG